MGRLTREVLLQTDPRRTVYVEPMSAWFEGNQEIVGIKTFSLIQDSVGVYGLSGMDRLLCFMLVDQLQQYCTLYEKNVTGPLLGALRGTHDTCSSPSVLSEQSVQLLSTISSRSGKLFQTMSGEQPPFTPSLLHPDDTYGHHPHDCDIPVLVPPFTVQRPSPLSGRHS